MTLAAILPALIVAVVGGLLMAWFARVQKDKDALSAVQVSRIYELEQWRKEHIAADALMKIAVVRLQEWREGTQEVLSEIKENMVRREDLDALSQRIDDALRRSSTPPPGRRR